VIKKIFLAAMVAALTVIPSLGWQAAAVTGKWELTIKFVDQDRTRSLRFVQEGEKLFVYRIRPNGEVVGEPTLGSIKGNELEWSEMIRGDRDVTLLYKGKIDGETVTGDLYFGDRSVYEWSAKKIANMSPAGMPTRAEKGKRN